MKTILIMLFTPVSILAQLALSEVMYNEPGARAFLEWVEVYNQADTAVNLKNYIFISGIDTTFYFNLVNAYIAPKRYAVLAKRLVAIDSSDSFEGHWGDSSGFWGDSPIENYRAFQAKMNLLNTSGAVYLINLDNGDADQCIWNGLAADGQSLERSEVDPPSEIWHLSIDPSGSTPGRTNSEGSAPANDLLLDLSSRMFSPGKGETMRIVYAPPIACQISLEIFDDSGRKQITLIDKSFAGGQVSWDGKACDGSRLPPGIYLLLSTLLGNQNGVKCIPVVITP